MRTTHATCSYASSQSRRPTDRDTLPFLRFEGLAAWAIAALLFAEIGITLRDFMIEDAVRRPLGGVFAGERATHAVMGIVYGAALAHLAPELVVGAARSTALVRWDAPAPLRFAMPLMAAGCSFPGCAISAASTVRAGSRTRGGARDACRRAIPGR
jgi:hypothetical protein